VQRAEVSTTDEGEAEEFIRQQYIENQTGFLSAPDDGLLSATAAQARGIAGINGAHLRFHAATPVSPQLAPAGWR
jgi:hypothetical protein